MYVLLIMAEEKLQLKYQNKICTTFALLLMMAEVWWTINVTDDIMRLTVAKCPLCKSISPPLRGTGCTAITTTATK